MMINSNEASNNKADDMPISEDPQSKAMLGLAFKAAKSHATILIRGETGVGKELIAHYIHRHSLIHDGPFVSVNCAAMPDNMIEAILFGYEKGAFTGAVTQYMGKFEQAQGGTLFLDEIAEIPLSLQAKLLRVLQEREIERLGGKKIIPVNVRIVVATNRDLEQQVATGSFRSDLYFRLNVVPIYCAPLRERPLDIIPLAQFFINKHAELLGRSVPTITNAAKEKLIKYSWPGNVRELDNVMHRAIIMSNADFIDENDLDLNDFFINIGQQLGSKLKENEATTILHALKEENGSRTKAAKKLNISPRTLRYKLSKLKMLGVEIP